MNRRFDIARRKKRRVCPKCGNAVALVANPTDDLMLRQFCAYCEHCDMLMRIDKTEGES